MTTEELKKQLYQIIENSDERYLRVIYATAKAYYETAENDPKPERKTEKDLHRLIYTSKRSEPITEQDVKEILRSSRKNNKALDVTGILIYTEKRFLQVLEGQRDTLTKMYEKIKKDKRHTTSILRFSEPVKVRYFEDWDMVAKKVNIEGFNYETDASEENKAMYKNMFEGDVNLYKDDGMRVLKTFMLIS